MEYSRFFEDTDYGAHEFADFFATFMTTGVIANKNQDALKVVALSGMQISIIDGAAMIKGRQYKSEGTTLTLSQPISAAERKDRIVLRMDLNEGMRKIYATVKTGTGNIAPELERSVNIYELSLAIATIKGYAITDILDERGNPDVCGFSSFVDAQANTIPAGAVISSALRTIPAGWLECNGQAVSRSVYHGLFSAIGTTYGSGDGVQTFNVPDLRGQFIKGKTGDREVGSRESATHIKAVGRMLGNAGVSSNVSQLSINGKQNTYDNVVEADVVPQNVALFYLIKC
jgi:hypothetical protein